jgi:diaminopimelate epimerase
MRFSKYHGVGNDFIMVADQEDRLTLTAELVRSLCDRRFGIGGDGVIRVAPGRDGGDLVMDYVNSDGSVGEMCGNGIRCLAIFAHDEGITNASKLKVETGAGLKTVEVLGDGRVRVDMGAPIFRPADIPVTWAGEDALHAKFDLDDEVLQAACLSMGNPHAVLFSGDPAKAPVTSLGPVIEKHPAFPNGTNVEFMRVDSPSHITMRVWERGAGETLACGTGACAVAVVGKLLGECESSMTISLPGGELDIEWAGSLDEEAPVLMTGPAVRSFSGDVDIQEETREDR